MTIKRALTSIFQGLLFAVLITIVYLVKDGIESPITIMSFMFRWFLFAALAFAWDFISDYMTTRKSRSVENANSSDQ